LNDRFELLNTDVSSSRTLALFATTEMVMPVLQDILRMPGKS
jgi:hypothetical protein